jgi:ABC-type antimicrobial peptide transport system permease subunit
MGMPLVAGRDFTWTDIHEKRRVAILSVSLARELFGSASGALGKRIGQGRRNINQEVIGVVADVRDNGVDAPAPATVYWPVLRGGLVPGVPSVVARNVTIVLRSSLAGTESLQTRVQQTIWAVNSTLAVTSVRTMQDIYDTSLARVSFALVMLAIAGAMALLLGVVGIYGVIAYTVTQRRRDIGIRLALGAQQGALRRAFVRDGLVLASLGVVIGVAAAVAATRFMTALLFEVSPLDPPSYLASAMVLMMAAALASYVPARRASAVPPLQALAAE